MATINAASLSSADIQSAINSASDGDTVVLPSGSATWTSGVTCDKSIHIQGGGSGRVIAWSQTSNTVGTGTKTWTVNASGLPISNGQTLRIWVNGGVRDSNAYGTGVHPWMEGTVSSYTGTTLQMSIGSSGESGTKTLWIVTTPATTTITHNAGASNLFGLTEDTTGSVQVSGIRMMRGTGTGSHVGISPTTSGKPVKVHDCWLDCAGSTIAINSTTTRGLVYECSFVNLTPGSTDTEGLKIEGPNDSWTTASTMGSADTNGTANFYVEDCDFHCMMTSHDADDSSRVVVRYCTFNESSGGGSHGADTSEYGVRHLEVYNNNYIFTAVGGSPDYETMNLNRWLLLRGGTGVVTDCTMPNITSSAWGDKSEIELTIFNVSRNAGPNACWGANVSGTQYHCPRQVGFGYVTGNGTDGLGRSNDSITYVGDSEPMYLWNNTGSPSIVVGGDGFGECTNPDAASSYIQSGRDYYTSAKPSYTKYTYPHPLRDGALLAGPANLRWRPA